MNKNRKIKIAILLGFMCFFLTIGIGIQINTVKNSTTTVGKTMVENELRDSVLRWKQKYDNAYKKLEEKEIELNNLREKAASTDANYSDLNSKLEKYNLLLGNTELIGKGITITLKDGDSSVLKGISNNYIVHDGDLYEIVNALRMADAEAISINGQRIVGDTSISCAGNIILINGKKEGVPFVINAIGSPSKLYGALKMPDGYIEWLERDGVKVDIKPIEKETIVIPKYEGVYKFEHATILEQR